MSKPKSIAEIKKMVEQVNKFHAVKVEFTGANNWRAVSGGNVYLLEAFFAGYDSRSSHGYRINTSCTCDAGRFNRDCVHAQKVRHAYEHDHSKLFPLFGLDVPNPVRFAPLWEKAREISDRLEANQFQQIAA